MTLDEWLLETRAKLKETREKLHRFEAFYRDAARKRPLRFPLNQSEKIWVDDFEIWALVEDTGTWNPGLRKQKI